MFLTMPSWLEQVSEMYTNANNIRIQGQYKYVNQLPGIKKGWSWCPYIWFWPCWVGWNMFRNCQMYTIPTTIPTTGSTSMYILALGPQFQKIPLYSPKHLHSSVVHSVVSLCKLRHSIGLTHLFHALCQLRCFIASTQLLHLVNLIVSLGHLRFFWAG